LGGNSAASSRDCRPDQSVAKIAPFLVFAEIGELKTEFLAAAERERLPKNRV